MSVCHGYMCILVYMKLMQCSGCCIYLRSIGGGHGISLPWVYVHSAICETCAV